MSRKVSRHKPKLQSVFRRMTTFRAPGPYKPEGVRVGAWVTVEVPDKYNPTTGHTSHKKVRGQIWSEGAYPGSWVVADGENFHTVSDWALRRISHTETYQKV